MDRIWPTSALAAVECSFSALTSGAEPLELNGMPLPGLRDLLLREQATLSMTPGSAWCVWRARVIRDGWSPQRGWRCLAWAKHRTNKVIAFDDIAYARLVRGITANGMRITLQSGARHKLLWLTTDPASAILSSVLARVLGDRLR